MKLIAKIISFFFLISLIISYLASYIHPADFWILPFFGLAYPIIALCSLLLLVAWAMAKSRMFFIVLFALVIGGKIHFRTLSLPIGLETKQDQSSSLKIISYNVRLFGLYQWDEQEALKNRDSIFSFLQHENADVICFQEFYQQDKPTRFSTRDTLKTILNTPYCQERYSHKLSGRQNFGIAMLSKYPMISRGEITFTDPKNTDNNYCIFGDIVKGKDTFRVFNVHLQSIKLNKDDYSNLIATEGKMTEQKSTLNLLVKKLSIAYPKRTGQALKVIEHMNDSPYPIIICGDFNDTPMSYVYNQFNSLYTDAFRNSKSGIGVTYAGKIPAGRIDYIFHSPNLHSANFNIQKNVFSDHKAISCEVWK